MSSQGPVAVVGEAVADAFTVPGDQRLPGELTLRVLPGGGPANTAVALSRLGTPTRFVGRLSDDAFGRLFREHLTESGVDLTGCVAATQPSTLAVADLDDDGQAQYTFHAEGTADWQWSAQELRAALPEPVSALHTGSLALARAPGAAHIEALLDRARPQTTVSVDPNVRPRLVPTRVYREALPRWCALADILKVSMDDLTRIHPELPPERACDAWHSAGAHLVVVTLGPDGALASLAGRRVRVPAPRVRTVDSVGAGDAFTAGLLHWLHRRGRLGGRLDRLGIEEVRAAIGFATEVAALTCTVSGANPPYGHQLDPVAD